MSNELKMSDVFRLPVEFDVQVCKLHLIVPGAHSARMTHPEHIIHAINNHDALTEHNHLLNEECEQLKADKDELFNALRSARNIMNTVGLIMRNEDYNKSGKVNRIDAMIDVHMGPIFKEAEDLLNKHKGE